MIKANFSAYSTYVTDSLHQWDIDQVLQVTGLNLTNAPEVHFSNANMDRAIVCQSTMTNHVVTVNIPNSLLQDPLRIYAHIGIYVGSLFKVVEVVEIPVQPRKRPMDYQIEDSDEELYSFKRLENEIANMATKAQVANIVAGVGSDAELVDVRYGADGKTYASAGEAVRVQMKHTNDDLSKLLLPINGFIDGGFIRPDNTVQENIYYKYAKDVPLNGAKSLAVGLFEISTLASYIFTDDRGVVLSYREGKTTQNEYFEEVVRAPAGAAYVSVTAISEVHVPADVTAQGHPREYALCSRIDLAETAPGAVIGAAFGDSITAGYKNADVSYVDIVKEKLGLHAYHKYAVSGSHPENMIAQMNGLKQSGIVPDFITLASGTNDYTVGIALAQVKTTIASILDTFLAEYPTTPILYILPMQRDGDGVSGVGANSAGYTLQEYVDAVAEVCAGYSVPTLDLYREAGINTKNIFNFATDGIHPNAAGHDRLATLVAAWVKKYM